ncbi:MAG: methylenetetrahydrofolate reductase [Lentisphaeraceae bacterium]|nr:methylenetetrahydrofolate reductase [Lentisphaeraceae bacterium]
MSRISIELVPRTEEVLLAELATVKEHFPHIDTVNIPDIMRLKMRSWEACSIAKDYVSYAIPHIRSIDFCLDKNPEALVDVIENLGLSEVLIVTGDPPMDLSRKVYRTSSTRVVRFLKKNFPEIKVYSALDPYRSGLKDEIDYVKKKIDSGADAFFTQPFFDVRYMDIYSEQLENTEVYWGVSPVLGERSQSYWENRNNAFFPKGFEPTLEWNKNFAKQALEFVKSRNENIYFMPIKTDLVDYLSGVI